MFFEGSEKKLEVVVTLGKGLESLRSLGDEYWSEIVAASQAKILSKMSSASCDAYLLSESSLFVWDDHFTMITCGQTTLVPVVKLFLQSVPLDRVESLIFERKNEYFPHRQTTDFYEDIGHLRQLMPGKAYRFGRAEDHHLFLFHLDRPYSPPKEDVTLEILMYDLQAESARVFSSGQHDSTKICELTSVDKIFSGFQIDDYVFEPCGYSLNALNNEKYYTIHVTPQEASSYVSFETNYDVCQELPQTIQRVIEVFRPGSFDVALFHPERSLPIQVPGFELRSQTSQELKCGYGVTFTHYESPHRPVEGAYEIKEWTSARL